MHGKKQNACGDVVFTKHCAERKECLLKAFPRMELCEDVLYRKIHYVDERSGLERSIWRWFKTILETSLREKVVLRESNWELWIAIVNEDVAKVVCAYRESESAR